MAVAHGRMYIARVRNVSGRVQPEIVCEGGSMIPHSPCTLDRNLIRRRVGTALSVFLMLFVLLLATQATGHAILVRSAPKANEVVASGDLKLELEFNARIDAARSALILVLPSGETEKLELLPQPSPAILIAKASHLAAGAYSIRWQVLTNDGHITRGEVPFKVK